MLILTRRTLIGLAIVLLFIVTPARADFEMGLAAYRSGDYATALKEWRPLAEQGLAKAQHNLGVIYQKGRGVPPDYSLALDWYRRAAEQGFALSQFNLGVMYLEGQGAPKDHVQAYMWLKLADANGDEKAMARLNVLEKLMTSAQIAQAQKLARDFKPKK